MTTLAAPELTAFCRKLARPVLLAAVALAALSGCDDGFTTEEATSECNRQREVLASCFDDSVYAQCISCHEDCGRECSLVDGALCGWTCD